MRGAFCNASAQSVSGVCQTRLRCRDNAPYDNNSPANKNSPCHRLKRVVNNHPNNIAKLTAGI